MGALLVICYTSSVDHLMQASVAWYISYSSTVCDGISQYAIIKVECADYQTHQCTNILVAMRFADSLHRSHNNRPAS